MIVFLSLGLRFGEWSLSLFWAVPLVVLVFSFVYAMHVLVSVWSGSTVLGLLAAFLVWGVSVLAEWTEAIVYQFAYTVPQAGMKADFIEGGVDEVEPREDAGEVMVGIHGGIDLVRTVLPKTRATGAHLRNLLEGRNDGEGLAGKSLLGSLFVSPSEEVPEHILDAERRADKRHPVWKDVGSSLFYEVIVVGLAVWIFSRRDY